jgi:hypothetical protein
MFYRFVSSDPHNLARSDIAAKEVTGVDQNGQDQKVQLELNRQLTFDELYFSLDE